MKPNLSAMIIVAAVTACTPAAVTTSTAPGIPAHVVDVQDGDSLVVEIEGTEERVRLIGVNAPESDECFGDEAADGLRQLVGNADVEIVTDVEQRDQYERLLAYVYQDGILVNEEIAQRGWVLARAYEPNTVLQNSIDAAAQDARQNQRGMWSPATCMASGPSVAITEIEANPPGPDEDNLNGEWVTVINADQAEIDLTGWTLRDASSVHRYLFPRGTKLAPGEELIVHTGCGQDEAGNLYWCAGGPVWSNAGDSALLLDTKGHTAATFDY
jgi:micrococcal nuclease